MVGNIVKNIININHKAIIEVFIEVYFKVVGIVIYSTKPRQAKRSEVKGH